MANPTEMEAALNRITCRACGEKIRFNKLDSIGIAPGTFVHLGGASGFRIMTSAASAIQHKDLMVIWFHRKCAAEGIEGMFADVEDTQRKAATGPQQRMSEIVDPMGDNMMVSE